MIVMIAISLLFKTELEKFTTTNAMTTNDMTNTTDMTTNALSTNALTTNALTTNALTTNTMTTNAMTTNALTTNTMTTNSLTTNALTTNALTTNALTTNAMTTNTMTTNAMTTNAMTTNALTTNAMTTNALTTNAMTTNALTTNALTTNAMTTNALTTNALTTNAMTTNALTTNAMTSASDMTTSLGTDMMTTSLGSDVMTTSLGTDVMTTSLGSYMMTTSLGTDVMTTSLGTDVMTTSLGSDMMTTSAIRSVTNNVTSGSATTTSFVENTIISFLVNLGCNANESTQTNLRNNVSYLIQEALNFDTNYSVTYNCYNIEAFNAEPTSVVEVVIEMTNPYVNISDQNRILNNLYNRLQNGITLDDNVVHLKKYNESDESFFKFIANKKDYTSITEPSIKFQETNVNGRLGDILSKNACVIDENTCNFGHIPYSLLRLDGINPDTNKNFTEKEKNNLLTRFSNKCATNKNAKNKRCCDPNDVALDNIVDYLPDNIKNKYDSVIVEKCNNKITNMKVCRGNSCDNEQGTPRKPTGYEYCKLLNINDEDIDEKNNVDLDKLVSDCYTAKCSNSGVFLEIDKIKNKNEIITKHYYLIEATKNDNVEFLKANYEDNRNNINEVLQYGYPGNTILHEALYYNAQRCVDYILSRNVNLSLVNKDGNSPLHIGSLKGSYDTVNKLLKLGANANCENNKGDSSLHSAVRSGSYNTVLVILDNGGNGSLLKKNKYGEIPLHSAVLGKKLNFNIVKLLVDNGSEIHSINKYGETILKTLMKNHKSVARESIRTFLHKKYYEKYDEEEYNSYLSKYPELRPISIDTSVDESLKKDYENYDDKNINFKKLINYNEDLRDSNLYIKKKTYLTKDKIDEKYFNDDNYEIPNSNKNTKSNENSIEGFSTMNNIEEFTNISYKINNKNKKCGIQNNTILIISLIILFIVIAYFVNTKLLK